MRKFLYILTALAVLVGSVVAAPSAVDASRGTRRLPSTIGLPEGYFPEGIASGRGSTFYVSSLADGSIYRGDYRTGEGEVLTEPVGGFSTIGLNVDRWGRVWAAGGVSGQGRVFDGRTGELLASFQFTDPLESFVNDVIVTRDSAWFTDSGTSINPDPDAFQFAGERRLFQVPLGPRGRLPASDGVEVLPVDMPDISFPNLNGIETTPDGRSLIVAHNTEGTLYRVDPHTGAAEQVAVDRTFTGPDGLLRLGRRLVVVEPGANSVTTLRLDRRGTEGEIMRSVVVPGGESPTTAAAYRNGVYVVDAKFFSQTGPYVVTRLPQSCRRVHTTGSGEAAPPQPDDPPELNRTVAVIDRGLLRGTTEASFTPTGVTAEALMFEGELTFITRRGTLDVTVAGSLELATGAFETTNVVTGGTDRFEGAIGNLAFEGVQDLTDPDGAFTETLTGEVCFDRH